MRNENLFDANEIRRTIATLKGNDLFEVRILKGKKTYSGYFTDAETLIKQLGTVDLRGTNVYLTLNILDPAVYSRAQHDKFIEYTNTTSDSDVVGYQWMLIDFDPNRATGVSSSEAELEKSKALCKKVYLYLQGLGFEEPVIALSGNGYHLLYRISLKKNEENIEIVHRCLDVLADMFNTDDVKIDTVNFNPSRICKLHGTLAQKGANTEERPHRMSKIISRNDSEPKATDKAYLIKLGEQLPKVERKKANSNYKQEQFDLEGFLQHNGLTYRESVGTGRDNSEIFALDECPFDHNHRDGDAKIFRYPDGAIAFKCHHNSCSKYRWQDVRLKYDPHAYDKKDFEKSIADGYQQHNREKEEYPLVSESSGTTNTEDLFRTASAIYKEAEPENEYIRSGIDRIDTLMHGLEKQCLSLMSGLRASGKSTLIGTMILRAIEDDNTVVVYSGELANKKYLNWLMRQAAGKSHLDVSTIYPNGVGITEQVKQKIINWMGDKFWLYNNKYGNNFQCIADALEVILTEKRADLCIIDNLMALDLTQLNKMDKYDAQTQFMLRLKDIAQKTNTHVLVVAHPRKAFGFIRLDDVSGTGNISNIVDNAFMVHRINNDFKKNFKAEFNKEVKSFDKTEKATNVIEIAKDRENGTMDEFIPLYFEEISKRLRNSPTEDEALYSWDDEQEISSVRFEEVFDPYEELPFK